MGRLALDVGFEVTGLEITLVVIGTCMLMFCRHHIFVPKTEISLAEMTHTL